MSVSNVNNAAAPRQVTCETEDNDLIQVDLDVLNLSGTFKTMYDDLGMKEHDEFPGVFRVRTVNSLIFYKMIDWCKEHKDDQESIIEKDPLSQECTWFDLTEYDKGFFEVPMPELLDLVMAANFLDVPRLYHDACQSVAARIKGKRPCEIRNILQQNCDMDDAQIFKLLGDNPWLEWFGAFPGALIENPIFIPNEVLLNIFEKLPREDLERLQLVSTQFNDVIGSSSALPLRIVAKLVFKASLGGFRLSQLSALWLRDGTVVTSTNYEKLAKRLKFSIVEKLRVGQGGVRLDDIQGFIALLPVKSAWKNATVEVSTDCFDPIEPFEFLFTELFWCKEIVLGLDGEGQSITWWNTSMRFPAIAACNKLDTSLLGGLVRVTDVVEWLEHELPPEKKWSEPRQLIICQEWDTYGANDDILTALTTAFLASSSPKPYVVRIRGYGLENNLDEVLTNEKTHEVLSMREEPNTCRRFTADS